MPLSIYKGNIIYILIYSIDTKIFESKTNNFLAYRYGSQKITQALHANCSSPQQSYYDKFRNPKTLDKMDEKQKGFLRKVHNNLMKKINIESKKKRSPDED